MPADYNKYIYSTATHWISNCGKNEVNKYHGGAAGDQTGKEYQLRPWYNRPWSCILRHPDNSVRMLIAYYAIEAALNNNIGYDQDQRGTFWTQLEKSGYNPASITAKCEADCTSSTSSIIKAVGFTLKIPELEKVSPSLTSRSMLFGLVKAGFQDFSATKYTQHYQYLLPGDVLLYISHHAAINISIGKYATLSNETKVIITGNNVNVRSGPGTTYPHVGIAHKADTFDYLSETIEAGSGWRKILYSGTTAWVSAKYSRLI